MNSLKGKTCLITGGGGSIGREIARSAARLGPERIVITDIYENGAYDIKCELGSIVTVEIASVRDAERMKAVFEKYRPDIVIHAAAHKHVPFMEENPEEAVKNNIGGTRITAALAEEYRAENFVLISTDKAVEPVSIMGASKRVCEMLVYEMSIRSVGTKFSAVRFGNVLMSAGSVIPLFKKQAKTGVVTVTHPEVRRYFMSVGQAAQLVTETIFMARGGEVFVLDMGEDVKILDVARGVIREAGLREGRDVRIEFTGLRRGDKLREKLFYDFEEAGEFNGGIMRVKGSSTECFWEKLQQLQKLAETGDRDSIRALLNKITNTD